MRRRDFIKVLAGSANGLTALAQQGAPMPRIGALLDFAADGIAATLSDAFRLAFPLIAYIGPRFARPRAASSSICRSYSSACPG